MVLKSVRARIDGRSHSLVAGNLKRHRCSVAVRKAQDFVVHILDILLVAEAHHKQAVVNAYKVKLAEALVHKAIAVPEGTEIAVLEDMVTRIAGRAAALRSVDTVAVAGKVMKLKDKQTVFAVAAWAGFLELEALRHRIAADMDTTSCCEGFDLDSGHQIMCDVESQKRIAHAMCR